MNEDIRTNVVFIGRYQVQRELGRGGMGAVYLAFDLQHRKSVAIKVARLGGAEARAQFRREALYLQKLTHHSLPRVLDVFSDTQRDFLVMEYIPGDDLEALVRQQGPQPEWLVLRWADELLDVLDYLHTQDPPIIHRDVKPGNLKLRENGTVVLVDFGIAAERRPEQDALVGMTAVTPGYSPPEQYTDSPADARTDVYAAGATLYYLLTGVAPAAAPDRASETATLAPVRKLAPKTSANTDALLNKSLHLAGEERWANAAEMRRAAAVASRKLASAAPPAPLPDPVLPAGPVPGVGTQLPAGKRRVGMAAVLGLVGVALLAAAVLLWTIGGRPPGASPVLPEPTTVPLALASTATPATAAVVDVVEPAPTLAEAAAVPSAAGEVQPAQETAKSEPATTVPAISTAIPRRTPTPTATSPATTQPTATVTPTARATVAPSAAPPAAASSQPAVATSQPTAVSASLLEPAGGMVGGGARLFRWQASQALSGNQAFELVFWRPGQDAMGNAFGPAGVTQNAQHSVTINLDEADATLGALLDPGDYLWGVMWVETTPYRRIGLISEARAFRFERSGGGVGQPADQPPAQPTQPRATDTPAPPPPSGSFVLAAQPRDLRHAGAGGVLGLGVFVVVLGLALWRPRRLL